VKYTRSRHARFAAALAFLTLAGCVAGIRKHEDASVIRDKAVQRWDLLISHDAAKAYDYLSPGYRATISRATYAQRMDSRGIHWKKVRFGSQKCDSDVCHVKLIVDYTLRMAGPTGTVKSTGFVNETWIRVDGGWYFLPEALQPTKLGKEKHS